MIAKAALHRLDLDQVWLMVTPGNPLKTAIAPLAQRLESAAAIADGRRIVTTAIESKLGTLYTRDTLRRLQTAFPRARFIWLTGADNFVDLPRWRDWKGILSHIPFAIFPRPGSRFAGTGGKPAHRFAHARLPGRVAKTLACAEAPAWMVITLREDATSSTAIRAQSPLGKCATPR